MAAQRGKDILLKIAAGENAFETCAGLRTKRIAFNAETVDVTDADAAGRWRQLLAGSGVQRASVSGSGIFKDAASDALIRSLFFNGEIPNWQVVLPDFGTITGPFQIVALEYGGNHDAEVTFEIALESAGLIAFGEAL
ncbi:phage major tail protein, TP901-1 family [Ochrobactrum sp. MYb15]|uniref:phage major tail protein, TP901-1 family n=1 Tax=Brucella pituitosa TaxID=571256 RepID=UPI0001C877DE|nr:phage major tail protein, TP901-1 family [Ochrobactrum sp. MYb19]PRA57218.1 phage major tail protein, TP901-1 family [Ochrobactrum sp. MYb68]PRA66622.1 phage major tail protein, TP901-1 family [Ochrobactrum sp. MYb18]PRA76348.1 phage major tail protein, TP901-1 family [Brucella thiophenivorans]PRA91632.1 phage major tail protein, TP901-1 family [Ochrobactrum sp. MYb14]PRA98355.1 phage major tail protein, TP901-1 family [Ochrobactrum sp. MYb15]